MTERIERTGNSSPRPLKIKQRVAVMTEPAEYTLFSPVRLGWGVEILAAWADTAGQIQQNAVYEALFAVSDRSVFSRYEILDDGDRPLSFFVVVREHLVVKIQFRGFDVFGIGYIGPFDGTASPDLDHAAE